MTLLVHLAITLYMYIGWLRNLPNHPHCRSQSRYRLVSLMLQHSTGPALHLRGHAHKPNSVVLSRRMSVHLRSPQAVLVHLAAAQHPVALPSSVLSSFHSCLPAQINMSVQI